MFWLGLILGLWIGGAIGGLAVGVVAMSKVEDEVERLIQDNEKPRDRLKPVAGL